MDKNFFSGILYSILKLKGVAMKEKVFAEFIPEYNAFGIKDEVVEAIAARGNIPEIYLKDKDLQELAPNNKASSSRPLSAFLLGREKGTYTIDYPYAKAIAQSGASIKLISYNDVPAQLEGVDGLILPGGAFDSPDEFYTDPLTKTDNKPGLRSYAYVKAIMEAEKAQMPILGICAGAQIAGGMHGLKMYRNIKEQTNSSILHKSKDRHAHKVIVDPNSPLFDVLGTKELVVNSRHNEGLLALDKMSDLKIYASAPDGTPEAWGKMDRKELFIQWHPEDFAAEGDKTMQNIYNWHSKEARIYKKQKEASEKSFTLKKAVQSLVGRSQMNFFKKESR